MGSIGYARVSTAEQNSDLQHAALKAAGCHPVFTDHGVSGSRANRPELDKMLGHLRDGDEVVVWKLDRLGRNTRNLLALIDDLERRGAFPQPHGRHQHNGVDGQGHAHVMSAFAQLERDQLVSAPEPAWLRLPNTGEKPGDGKSPPTMPRSSVPVTGTSE